MQSTQDFVKDKNTVWLSIISSAPGTQGYISPEKANEYPTVTQSIDIKQAIPKC